MKRRALVPCIRKASSETSTGARCPATGWWIPLGAEESWQYVSEGNLMPEVNDEPAVWILASVDTRDEIPVLGVPSEDAGRRLASCALPPPITGDDPPRKLGDGTDRGSA